MWALITNFLIVLFLIFGIASRVLAYTERALVLHFVIVNPIGQKIDNVHFYTYLPLSTPWQDLIKWQTSCEDYQIISDDLGNSILDCHFSEIFPYAQIPVTIWVWLKVEDQPKANNKFSNYLNYVNFPGQEMPEIKKLASKLKREDSYLTAKNIYLWIRNNIKFVDFVSKPLDISQILKIKQGDCTEGMSLFLALSQAAGVKSLGFAGYLIFKNGYVNPVMFHNWAIFYARSKWVIVDPKRGVFDSNYEDYVAFTIIGKRQKECPIGIYERFKVVPRPIKAKQTY